MNYTDEQMLEELRRVALELGRVPSRTYWETHPELRPSHNTYKNRFGSWNLAIKTAGLEPLRENTSKEEVAADIVRVASILGKTPTGVEYEEFGKFSIPTVHKYVGHWRELPELLDLSPQGNFPITAADVVESIRLVAKDIGHTPLLCEYKKHPLGFSPGTLYRFFPTIDAATAEAGLEPLADRRNQPKPHYSEEELLGKLQAIVDELGRSPTGKECVKHGLYDKTLTYRFGSLGNALAALGLETCKLNGYAWAGHRHYKCSDGHIVNSMPEVEVDEFLYSNGFVHAIQVKVCQERNWTCDFVVNVPCRQPLWLEVDGFAKGTRPLVCQSSLDEKTLYYKEHDLEYLILKTTESGWQSILLKSIESIIN